MGAPLADEPCSPAFASSPVAFKHSLTPPPVSFKSPVALKPSLMPSESAWGPKKRTMEEDIRIHCADEQATTSTTSTIDAAVDASSERSAADTEDKKTDPDTTPRTLVHELPSDAWKSPNRRPSEPVDSLPRCTGSKLVDKEAQTDNRDDAVIPGRSTLANSDTTKSTQTMSKDKRGGKGWKKETAPLPTAADFPSLSAAPRKTEDVAAGASWATRARETVSIVKTVKGKGKTKGKGKSEEIEKRDEVKDEEVKREEVKREDEERREEDKKFFKEEEEREEAEK